MQIEALYSLFLSSAGVTTDTRNIAKNNMFFALKGPRFNANLFAAEALERGAQCAVIDDPPNPAWVEKYGGKLIVTDDALKTLQSLAGHHRAQLHCPVLAITGSNGKTTTKELVAAVLSKKYNTCSTKGNLNNHIGIPLTLLSIKPDVDFAVIEMGANHTGEIASYCEYVKPGYGLITNVGLAHIEGFGSFEGVVKGKTELYQYIAVNKGVIFVNGENDTLKGKIPAGAKVITYGNLPDAYCKATPAVNTEFLSLVLNNEGKNMPISTHLVGAYNFENVLSALCIGKYFGVDAGKMKEAIEEYIPSNNRSQKISYGTNTVILDAYNANPASMAQALKNFAAIPGGDKIVILGEMMELGDLSQTEHEKIAGIVEKMPLSKRVFTGAGFAFLKDNPAFTWFETSDALKQWLRAQQFNNYYMLVKGSRKNELEKLFQD